MPIATVLIATHDHGPLLRRSVGSALRQTVSDIEVVVVGDGVADETRAIVGELQRDPRVRFLDYPKAPSSGGANRHRALALTRGEIICYLDDDDLWCPDHVATLRDLLEAADFAHTLPIAVEPDGSLMFWEVDLARPHYRELLLEGRLSVAKSFSGHTAEVYRRLSHGWRGGPFDTVALDVWQQILRVPGCRVASTTRLTALQFPSSWRAGWSVEERLVELDTWARRLGDPDWPMPVLDLMARSLIDLRLHLDEVAGWHREVERYARSLEATLAARTRAFDEVERYARSLEAMLRDRSQPAPRLEQSAEAG